jgi:CRISPR/Cas system-associated exonuclease Cas4 (RecB family)
MRKIKRLTASVTELTQFTTCRRRWYLSRLYTGKTQAPALIFGSAIHAGLEGYFIAKKKFPDDKKLQKAAMQTFYIEYCEKLKQNEEPEYGILWQYQEENFDEMFELGRKILINYIDFDHDSDTPFRPLLVEKRIFIPLDPQQRNVLTMRWDAMGLTYNDLTAIVDHKTTSGGIISRGATLDLDEQMTGYAFGYWFIHHRQKLIDFIMYDTLSKKIPQPIRVLKSGKLSAEKSQDTIMPILVETVKEYKDDLDRFYELIDVLEEKGWDNFFRREASPRNEAQLRNYEERVNIIFDEMRAVIEDPRKAYPSPGPIKCPHCPFLRVCTSMEMDEDYKYMLEQEFVTTGKSAFTLPPRFTEMTG